MKMIEMTSPCTKQTREGPPPIFTKTIEKTMRKPEKTLPEKGQMSGKKSINRTRDRIVGINAGIYAGLNAGIR